MKKDNSWLYILIFLIVIGSVLFLIYNDKEIIDYIDNSDDNIDVNDTEYKEDGFQFLWNVGGEELSLDSYSITDDKVRIIYQGSIDIYPHIKSSIIYDGGVPQAMTEEMWEDYEQQIKDIANNLDDEIEYCVFDYESWFPSWDKIGEEYKQLSRDLILEKNSNLTDSEIEAQAKQEFEESARRYIILTINTAKNNRPDVKYGFYYYPYRDYWNSLDSFDEETAKLHDEMYEIWEVVDVLHPSVYQFYQSETDDNRVYFNNEKYIKNNIKEAQRIADEYDLEVVPYVWYKYHPSTSYEYSGDFLNQVDLEQMITIPYELGVDNIIMWGSVTAENKVETQTYVDNYLGNFVTELLKTSRDNTFSFISNFFI